MKGLTFHKFLWDLLPGRREPRREPTPPKAPSASRRGPVSARQARYDELVAEMKRIHGLRVNKWRSSTSGCAWQVEYRDGSISRLIESPYPRGPMSCAIFMHEVGHHAIGLYRYRPRCLEEYHAWKWGLEEMERRGFSVTDRVLARRDEALRYAVEKALRRGLRRLPVELATWAPPGVFQPVAADGVSCPDGGSSGEHVHQ
ncbi:MAG: hypothetical protein MK082_12615 [Phycisphaerales bacterium]|nr:hypothetical protein [Phycisphaerales bacterium]